MSCVRINDAIIELASHFPGESPQTISNLLGLWYEDNPKRDNMPSITELRTYMLKLRDIKVPTTFSVSSSPSYSVRTRENAEWSDITIALAQNFNSKGEEATKRHAGNKYISHELQRDNDPEVIATNIYNEMVAKGKTKDVKLNIAGNGIYDLTGSQEYYNDLMTAVISKLLNKGVTISAIRSGGQTGIDEAGIIAAQRLGIPSEVHSTMDYRFRVGPGANYDISDEVKFKSRFQSQLKDSKEAQLDKYIYSSGTNSGFLTSEGEKLLSSTFDKDKFNEGTTKVSLYPGSSGTEIRIDFKSQKTGKDYYAIYHGSPTRKVWDMYNSEGGNMTNVSSEQYWKNVRTVVPQTLLDLVESGKYAEMDSTPTKTDELGSIVYSTELTELFEREYNVLKQGRNMSYNTSVVQKALNILEGSASKMLDDALLGQTQPEQPTVEALASENNTEYTIEYTPKGKTRQTYTIKGAKIFNKEGKEVFKKDSVDRLKIFANFAIKQGRAVVVEHKGTKYVVNNRDQIISGTTGKLMKWGDENGDRKNILKLAHDKFNARQVATNQQTVSNTSTQSTITQSPSSSKVITVATFGKKATPEIKGEVISSRGSEFAQKLTNPGNNLEVEYKGKKFRNAEHAYQTWKSGEFDEAAYNSTAFKPKGSKPVNKATNYNTMVEILMAKLQQHPELIQGIIERGGLEYLRKSTHEVTGDKYWESSGQNKFIEALSEAFSRVSQSENIQIEETPEFEEAEIQSSVVAPQPQAQPQVVPEAKPIDEDDFAAPALTALEEQKAVDLVFDPQVRRDRVNFIARLFSEKLDELLKKRVDEIDKIMVSTKLTEEEKEGYRKELYALSSRESAINFYTPLGIFNIVKEHFQSYLDSSEEECVQAEFNALKEAFLDYVEQNKDEEMPSDEDILNSVKGKVKTKRVEYQKVVDHFNALRDEASMYLLVTEKLAIDVDSMEASEAAYTEDNPDGSSFSDDNGDNSLSKEESSNKDGWMTYFRHIGSHESLSKEVRKFISEMPKLGFDGMVETDDLGNVRYLDSSYVHATLIDKLRFMVTVEDMIPLLQKLAATTPWVEQVIEDLKEDEILFSKFYTDFRKDFASYWVQKRINNPDGTYTIETININRPESIGYLIDSWRSNYESGTVLTDNSIYNKDGSINKANARAVLKRLEAFNNKFQNKTTDERLELLNDTDNWEELMEFLKAVGISPNPATLRLALNNIHEEVEGVEFTDPIMLLLPELNIILSGVVKGKADATITAEGLEKRTDLINTFNSAYTSIANMMAEVVEDAIESSVREGDKTYYGHVNPSYLGKLVKQLKNVLGDEERFEEFIQKEFGQYEWFKKDGDWRNAWLKELVTNPKMRQALQHKVLINYDKIEYSKLDELDYTMVLLHEFWAEDKSGMAWYHVPILSDSPSAEFIRFQKFVNGSEIDKATRQDKTYQESILDRLADVVQQEYDRIQIVKERFDLYQAGYPIAPIANFDMVLDKETGNVSKGGSEFKFIPELNSYVFVDTLEDGSIVREAFLDRIERLMDSPTELKQAIKRALNDIMEEGFESTYAEWVDIGLLDETEDGKFKNLPSSKFSVGQSKTTKGIVKSLLKAKELLGGMWSPEMEEVLNKYQNNKAVNDKAAREVFEEIHALLAFMLQDNRITSAEVSMATGGLTLKNHAKEALRNYYWNSKLATSQIIQLTTTDLAYYKNLEDFQKRYKEVHAPSQRLNTLAKFHGKTVGRKWERTIYIKDDIIPSPSLDIIESILREKAAKGDLDKTDVDFILSQFRNINVADAQAYRSLSSYKAVMAMMGDWTDEMETAMEHLENGAWTIEDFMTIWTWQTKKPYLYTQIFNADGIHEGKGLKTPVQHKNSEFLLLAIYNSIAGPMGKSDKLKAINDFMEKNTIDVVQFESTTKVGLQSPIELSTSAIQAEQELLRKQGKPATEYDAVTSILERETGIASGTENPNVIHTVSYEDYGIQTATPEHLVDHIQLIGTQIRKLITADLTEDITINGKTMTKERWLEYFNEINTENILQSFKEVDKIFEDPKEVEKILLEEVRSNPRYGIDMVRACTLDPKTNTFNIPLYDPVQSQRVQTLLNSIIKSRVTKQKIKGGSLIQVSAFGLTDDLHIVFKDAEGNEISFESYKKKNPYATKEGYQEWVKDALAKGNISVKHWECYMPAYSRELFEPLMDENGQLDINKLPEELRRAIGYRVPTEAKYSMAPLYIKGFLPAKNGSAIMLPAEITTISGSDFDVDKMYIMLPEFHVRRYNMDQAKRDFEKSSNALSAISKMFRKGSNIDTLASASLKFNEWFEQNKERYKLERPEIDYIRYNYKKSAHEQSLKARNNALIELMWGVLTSSAATSDILNPGGFEKQKRASRVVEVLNYMYEEDLAREGYTYDTLLKASTKDLDKLLKKYKKILDPLSPRTQVILHQQNMTGAQMIGIYANHNANHALMQHTELALDTENGAFMFNGEVKTSLHNIKNSKGEFITRNTANFLGASVDNVKDNTLHATNQNTFTGDAAMLLSRLGYNPIEIAILMRQPIVVEMTQEFFKQKRTGKSKKDIIEQVIKDRAKYAKMYDNLTYDRIKEGNKFMLADLMKNIVSHKSVEYMTPQQRETYYRNQVTVGLLFQRIMNSADALADVVAATRADTQGGAAGPTIADTMIKIQKVRNLVKQIQTNEKFPLIGANVIDDIGYSGNIDSMRRKLLTSRLPYLQAFYSLGIKETEKLMGRYFPHYTKHFQEVLLGRQDADGNYIFKGLYDYTKSGKLDVKTINSIYNDLLLYIMSKTSFFGRSINKEGKYEEPGEKRRRFINDFPAYFQKVVRENEDIANLEFIKRLSVISPNAKNPVSIVIFNNIGKLSPILRERFMRDWATMLYMDNPKAQELALNLFLYSSFRNGFAFGPSTFIHLAPVALRQVIPDYISTLRGVFKPDDYREFITQYIYNHLDNRRFVPLIPKDSPIAFTNSAGEILSSISITIHDNSKDMTAVKEVKSIDGEKHYKFMDFIAKNVGNKTVYYRLNMQTGNTAVYDRIEPLGYKNNFLEYEYGRNVEEMKSVIDVNRMSDSEKHSTEFTSSDNVDYDSFSTVSVNPGVLDKTSKDIYGQSFFKEEDENPFTSIEPNKNYEDAEGKPMCK